MGSTLSRREMLRLALMSSENRAASSLARHYPGGTRAFVDAMNFKAASLGLSHTHYADPTGLSAENVSTAKDLAKLVQAAAEYPMIRDFTTTPSHFVEVGSTGQTLGFNNSNSLVKNQSWDIQLQKTGYIREAGKCVVMQRLRRLFDLFEQKTSLLHLLDVSQRAQGVQIYIGGESGLVPLDDCSVVTASYEANGQVIGTLGVIGPTRMSYARVIPIVDVTAKLLSNALSREFTDD